MSRLDRLKEQNPELNISLIDMFAKLDPTDSYKYLEFIIKHLKTYYIDDMASESVDKILVSSHKDVRDALVKNGISFVLVYPDRSLKDEYIQRYKDRGNNDAFVKLLDDNWDTWMDEMDSMKVPYKVRLGKGQYLTDVID